MISQIVYQKCNVLFFVNIENMFTRLLQQEGHEVIKMSGYNTVSAELFKIHFTALSSS